MVDRFTNSNTETLRASPVAEARVAFLVDRGRLAGCMRSMAEAQGFEAMKAAVEDELRRAARQYGKDDGWMA